MTATRPRRLAGALITLTLVGGASAAVGTPARAAASSCTFGNDGFAPDQDIDHDQRSDLVIGVPQATVAGHASAGAVDVHYAASYSGTHRTQRVTENSLTGLPRAAAGDRFGATTAFAELDAADQDACHDLAIGVPGARGGRGAVDIVPGSLTGLATSRAQQLTGRTAGEHFGYAVVVMGNDIWIGAPDREVAGHVGAGAIDHYRITAPGTVQLLESITENSPGVPGVPQTGAHFGAVMHSSITGPWATPFSYSWPTEGPWGLVIGEPLRDVGRAKDAGSVTVLNFDATTHRVSRGTQLTQDSPGVTGTAETGDHFGAAVWGVSSAGLTNTIDIAVGVPGEDFAGHRDAGEVQDFRQSLNGGAIRHFRDFVQGSGGVPGRPESGDRFGASLVANRTLGDQEWPVLAVGAPGEDVGPVADAGTVTVLLLDGGNDPAVAPRIYYRGHGLPGRPERGDLVGQRVTVLAAPLDLNDPDWQEGAQLVIGAPGEDVGSVRDAGGVVLLDPVRHTTRSYGDSAGARRGEAYGTVGPTSPNG